MVTTQTIIQFSTIIVTFLLGFLVKKYDIIESQKIPIQNAMIGIIAGLICFAVGIYDNVFYGVITCFIYSMAAGGIYDTAKTKIGGDDNDNEIIK